MIQDPGVRIYFEKTAADFDTIYTGKKSAAMRRMDRMLRWDMYERFRLTLEECRDPAVRSILDVGTGSGRFCLPLVSEKDRVLGVDFSEAMIALARKNAERAGVENGCEFRAGDFLEMNFLETYDAILAIGLFDYIAEPHPFLRKMQMLASKKVIATFPRIMTWRALPRWLRLNAQGCPVYFFSENKVKRLFVESGFRDVKLTVVGKIYLAVAKP